eukprot:SAG31_NODE_6934_length_1844_cov_2.869341_2_plen_206_part_00
MISALLLASYCTSEGTPDDTVDIGDLSTGGMQKISFKPPKLDEEENDSMVIPPQYRCDSCRGIAHQMNSGLLKAEKRKSKTGKKLNAAELIDTFESRICVKKTFEDYGIKGLADPQPGQPDKMLNGPGTHVFKLDVPGVIQGGGKWPNRLVDRCSELVGEIGDEELYQLYREGQLARAHRQDCLAATRVIFSLNTRCRADVPMCR